MLSVSDAVADLDTLKMKAATQGSSEKKKDAWTLFAIFFDFTYENDKVSNKKEGCQALHPPPGSAYVTKAAMPKIWAPYSLYIFYFLFVF